MRVSKDPDIRRNEIIHTAIELFLEKGYEKTSVSDITRRIKVSQGLFYNYFTSKEDIFNVSLDEYIQEGIAHYSKLLLDNSKTLVQKIQEFGGIASIDALDNDIDKFYNLNDSIKMQVMLRLNAKIVPLVTEALMQAYSKKEIDIEKDDIPNYAAFIIYGQFGVVIASETDAENIQMNNLKIIEKILNLKLVAGLRND